jgi:hypothetical protein
MLERVESTSVKRGVFFFSWHAVSITRKKNENINL